MDCKKCILHKTRRNIVWGYGNKKSPIMIIGEAPGRNEDIKGKPFVGRAGIILDEILDILDLTRDDVYITNVVKCRPPNNRNPTDNEIESCFEYFNSELQEIDPKIIIPMGKFATRQILKIYKQPFNNISESRGQTYMTFDKKMICPLYHPAALIYNNSLMDVMKRDVLNIGKLL